MVKNTKSKYLAILAMCSVCYGYNENTSHDGGLNINKGTQGNFHKRTQDNFNKNTYDKSDINVNKSTRYRAYKQFEEKENAGFFIGLDAGAVYAGAFGFNVGGNLGYQYALSDNFTLKVYIDYRYMRGESKQDISATIAGTTTNATTNLLLQAQMATANLDFYLNFRGFSIFFGVGMGYFGVNLSGSFNGMNFSQNEFVSNFTLPFNVGLAYRFKSLVEISLFSKIPLLEYEYNTPSQQSPLSGRVYMINAGISFLF